MPAYVTIRAVERGGSADPMSYLPGYAVQVDDHSVLGGKVVPPKYCELIVTDATPEELRAVYTVEWARIVDWEVVGSNLSIDGHRLRAFILPEYVSQSGLNSLTREQVESYLNNWGAKVFSVAPNSVTFDATIANAIKSNGFWGMDVSGGVFTELSYDQASGLHTTRVTYSGIPGANATNVSEKIVEQGRAVTAIQPSQSRVTFTCTRTNAFQLFKADVKSKLDGVYARRKWRVTQAAVDAALAGGGSLTVTRDQMLDLWYSRLND